MAKKKNSASQMAVWVVIGLLIVGLAGFGTTSFTSSRNAVAEVGDSEISIREYSNALQAEINRLSQQFGTQLTFGQAQLFGVDRAVLSRLLTTAALESEADALGLSAGDDRVRDALLGVTAFQGVDGNFDREGYRFVLEQAGLSEGEYEETLRADLARGVLIAAVSGAAGMPQSYIDAILTHREETRDITYAMLTAADLDTPVPVPTEAELRAYWEEKSDAFMLPETRDIAYAWLTPEMIAGTIDGDDAALQTLYDERISEYDRPERRLVERLIFTAEADAAAAMAALEAEETTFEDLVAARDLTLADVDLGDVSQADLGAGGAAVFALEGPGFAGPVSTDLGFAIYRMNGILAAQLTTFEDAREELLVEYRSDAARRLIDKMIEEVDDLLAGGATIEELGADTELETGTIMWAEDATDGIAAYAEFRQAAAATEVDDFPEVIRTEDGAIFALRVNEVIAPRVEPFEDARARVEADWTRQRTVDALAAQGRALAEEMRNAVVDMPIPRGEDPMPDETQGESETFEELGEDPPAGTPDASGTETPPAESPAVDEAGADTPGTATDTPDADPPVADDTPGDDPSGDETPVVAGDDTPAVDMPVDPAADTPPPPAMITELGLARDGFLPNTPDGFVATVFAMDEGEIQVIEGTTAAYVVRLDAITLPDLADPDLIAAADALRNQLASSVGNDILDAYATEIQNSAGISLNQATLNAVHAQFPQ